MFKRLILTLLLAAGILSPVTAAGLYPLSNFQQFDSNAKLLSGARLFLFDGGTSTPRIGYKDSSLTTPHPNPILADSAGRLPLIYLADGFYRQRLTTKTGSLIFDQDGLPVLSSTAGGSGTSVDPNSIFKSRDIKIRFDNQPLAGYVRLNGRSIGSASSGATERANADVQPLYEELWSFANIAVVGGKGVTAVADFAANKPLALPNAAGRGLFGADDLGAGAQGILTSATIVSPTLIGSSGGFQTATIAQSNIPSYTLNGSTSGLLSLSGTTGDNVQDWTHTVPAMTTGAMSANASHAHTGANSATRLNTNAAAGGGFGDIWTGTGSATTSSTNTDHTHVTPATATSIASNKHQHGVTVNGAGSLTATVASGGSGVALAILPPIMTFMIYIRL